MLNRSVSPGDPTHHHQSRWPKSRLFDYLPDLPSDVIACMNPVMLNPSPHKGYHCLRVQTHHHHSRYPKSRLFGYLPDLPYVISCMNPVVMMMRSSPTSPRLYPAVQAHSIAEDTSQAKLQRWVPRYRTVSVFSKVDFLGTSQVYHRTSSLA